MIYLWNNIFKRKIFSWWSLWPLILSIFIFFLCLFRRRLFLFNLWTSFFSFSFLYSPSWRFFLQSNSNLIKNNRQDIFSIENISFIEIFILSFWKMNRCWSFIKVRRNMSFEMFLSLDNTFNNLLNIYHL